MAEGIEEAETNSSSGAGDATTSMLSAAMPCEVHEFETYHHQAIKRSVSTSPTPKIMPLMPMQSMRKVHESSNDFEPMSQYLQQHRLHQQRKPIATKRKQSTDDAEEDCHQQQDPQQQLQQQRDQQSTSQHDDDQQSQSSCSSLAPVSPPLRKLKTEVRTIFFILHSFPSIDLTI